MNAYIHNISYQFGEQTNIDSLPDLEDNEFLSEILNENGNGFKKYCSFKGSVFDLLKLLLQKSMVENSFPPEDIDMVIFASDSLSGIPQRMTQLGNLLKEHGLTNAYPLLVGFSECSNLQMALSIANSYVSHGQYKNILVIAVDLTSVVSPSSRVVKPGIAIMSDAAASCIVSGSVSRWQIKSVSQKTHPLLLQGNLNRKVDLTIRLESHIQLFDELFQKTEGIVADKITKIFASNFLPSILTIILSNCGFNEYQIFFDNISEYGHCLSSDSLINFKDYCNKNTCTSGDKVILYGEGTSQWGAILLEYK